MIRCTHSLRRGVSLPWLRFVAMATCGALGGCEPESGIDYGMNSSNVAQHLTIDDSYPFVGFWKLQPSDEFGLVINKGTDGNYTVWSCTERGSTVVESLSPTKLIGDDNFKVVNEDTIQILDEHGDFQTYGRFE